MPDLLTPIQTISSVKNRIVALEDSSSGASYRMLSGSQDREDRPLIEVAEKQPLQRGVDHQTKVSSSVSARAQNASFRENRRQVDSTPFVNQTYLASSSAADLREDACEILKSQPYHEDLLAVLVYLQCGIEKKHDFNIRAPSAKASQITTVLVNITLVDHWYRLNQKKLSQEDRKLKQYLLSCLASATGLGVLLAQITKLSISINAAGGEKALKHDMISVLEEILSPSATIYELLRSTLSVSEKPSQKLAVWQEFVSLLAGSKLLTVIAQASRTREVDEDDGSPSAWMGDGPRYCKWLARNIAHSATMLLVKEAEAWSMLAQITRRGLSLGNRDSFVAEIYSSLLLGHKSSWSATHELLRALPRWEQKAFFDGMMRDISRNHLRSSGSSLSLTNSPTVHDRSIEAVAGLVAGITKDNEFLRDYIVEWLEDDRGANASIGLSARRAVMATLADHEEKFHRILENCLLKLGDKLRIQHDPVLQQEATVQSTLLAVAYLDRLNHDLVKETSRSSSYIHAVSNRLGSSIPRARWLGMIVGVAISRLVDEPGKTMDFGAEEMEDEESKTWLSLASTDDKVGNVKDLQNLDRNTARSLSNPVHPTPKRKTALPKQQQTSKIISIEEVSDGSSSEDDDLIPYKKPDSDPSDSEEDPTLIDRSKPSAPVYILDLVKQLNKSDEPSTVHLALKTAPSLIRRKATFGSELAENIDRLAAALLNLSDGMSKPAAQSLRLQALIACTVAQPERIAPWLASTFFEGDLSLSQRSTLLTTLGLSARELAGFTDTEDTSISTQPKQTPPFPSKQLPPQLAALYGADPINTLTNALFQSTIQPMAASAADTLTGPSILKIRTFSSRLAVTAKRNQTAAARTARIPKTLHAILSTSFILPLTTHLLSTRALPPTLLALLLRTLTLLLHTLGPHSAPLPLLTRETLHCLLALHSSPSAYDAAVLPALLALLLCVLDLNVAGGSVAEERLVTDFGPQVAELMRWVAGLENVNVPTLETGRGGKGGAPGGGGGRGGGGEGVPWPVLAAGCQVKWQEVGRKFQGRMFGLVGAEMMDG